ncbi:hypothetical protein J6590_024411, partial [Homalodisca vitripennis]
MESLRKETIDFGVKRSKDNPSACLAVCVLALLLRSVESCNTPVYLYTYAMRNMNEVISDEAHSMADLPALRPIACVAALNATKKTVAKRWSDEKLQITLVSWLFINTFTAVDDVILGYVFGHDYLSVLKYVDSLHHRAWLLLGWVTAERSCSCKQPACSAVGGGSEGAFKPLVP